MGVSLSDIVLDEEPRAGQRSRLPPAQSNSPRPTPGSTRCTHVTQRGMMARRIQLRCVNGWRLSAGARSVARPGRWGNPFRVGHDDDQQSAIAKYRLARSARRRPKTSAPARSTQRRASMRSAPCRRSRVCWRKSRHCLARSSPAPPTPTRPVSHSSG